MKRIDPEIVAKIESDLCKINSSKFGKKKVKFNDYLREAVKQMNEDVFNKLAEETLTEEEIIHRDFLEYRKKNKSITKDQYYRMLRTGEIFKLQQNTAA